MFIVYDCDNLIIETFQFEPMSLTTYTELNQTVEAVDCSIDCLGYIYVCGQFIPRLTPFYTAQKGVWILTEENQIIQSQIVTMTCTQILMQFKAALTDNVWFKNVNAALLDSNSTRAYLSIRQLLPDAPAFINADRFNLE